MPNSTAKPSRILADIIHHMKYARFLPDKQRREAYRETVDRNMQMHIHNFPFMKDDIVEAYESVGRKDVLPSMRSMQFAGKAVARNNCRMYNCSFCHINHPDVFREVMYLLLSGCGVGYSVQKHHVAMLPEIKPVIGERFFEIPDSIEGWAMAVGELMDSYFKGLPRPIFLYDKIRPAGRPLITSGGVAPGPVPLREALNRVSVILEGKQPGTKLSPLECHDMLCHLADAVLSGGIRRSSFIALFSLDDHEMMGCKSGNWWEHNLQRSLANNSVMIRRNELTYDLFDRYWEALVNSGYGEPNIFQTNDLEYGSNPCGEISLTDMGFCNLVEINAATIVDQKDFNQRARVAALIATLQAAYTDFPLLRAGWSNRAQDDCLIGVGMTGIAAGRVMGLNLNVAAREVLLENERVAKKLGIKIAKRNTTVKPSGTTSLALGNGVPVSSGVHGYWDEHYLRRVIVTKTEPLYGFLSSQYGWMLEPSAYRPETESVITIPLRAPEGAITRNEGALSLLERVRALHRGWIVEGHREGPNTNNVSVTVPVRENEWDEVKEWWWKHRDSFVSITLLPSDGGTYKQLPFESCSSEVYEKMASRLQEIDFTKIREMKDGTAARYAVACSGGVCEIV